MKKLKITIPKPCHESWAKMTPSEQGRFCDQCAKEVIDFSKLSDAELIDQLQKTPQGCGKFKPVQIQRSYAIHNKDRHWKKAVIVLFPLLLSGSLIAQPLNPPLKTQTVLSEETPTKSSQKANSTRYLQGIVTDTNQETLIGTTVIIEKTEFGTVTDIDGSYELEIPEHLGDMVTISFHYTGYESQSVKVPQSQQTLNIQLEQGEFIVGEVVVLGGFTSKPQTLVGVVRRWLQEWAWKRAEKPALNQENETTTNLTFTEPTLTIETPSLKSTGLTFQAKLQVYPNPFEHFLRAKFNLTISQTVQFELINNTGQIIGKQMHQASKGPNSFDWDINDFTLTSGIYYLRLTQQNGEQETVALFTQ